MGYKGMGVARGRQAQDNTEGSKQRQRLRLRQGLARGRQTQDNTKGSKQRLRLQWQGGRQREIRRARGGEGVQQEVRQGLMYGGSIRHGDRLIQYSVSSHSYILVYFSV